MPFKPKPSGKTDMKEYQMHIEPGVVNEAKIILSYATAAGAAGVCVKNTMETLKNSNGDEESSDAEGR